MLAFSEKWDPRPIHLSEEAGRAAGFGGIIASGAYVDAIFTLLMTRARKRDGDHAVIAAMGAHKRFKNPTRAGDTLTLQGELSEKRASKSRPDAGVLHTLGRLVNQRDEVVLEIETITLVERRPDQARRDASTS